MSFFNRRCKTGAECIKTIALAGNPNVGKSTVFNGLTGLKQHTGNWAGKTVANAVGYAKGKKYIYKLVDIPGTYSLVPNSQEEKVASDYICFSKPDAVVVVCDATCIERNMNLVLQILEVTKKVILCVNLIDEAKKKGIKINAERLREKLGIPVVTTTARNKKELKKIIDTLDELYAKQKSSCGYSITYPDDIEEEIAVISQEINRINPDRDFSRWAGVNLLSSSKGRRNEITEQISKDFENTQSIENCIYTAKQLLNSKGIPEEKVTELVAISSVRHAEKICSDIITENKVAYKERDRKIDKILTSKITGYPIMILMLLFIFWLTITGANYPSQLLSVFFIKCENLLREFLFSLNLSKSVVLLITDGAFHTTARVISVMLPPMAIFFPLFTLIEDSGILPRIAYNLDKPFNRCNACGKQALTMCMGFGCNAAGVSGCRIIDSDREKKLAILTNCLVPCNGRFPTIIALITLFLIGSASKFSSLLSAIILTIVILIGILATFLITKLLSTTILKGKQSSYILELPSYRRPQIGQVIIRSVLDRTLFILGRAVAVAAPAGVIIWLLANIKIGNISCLGYLSKVLEPIGTLLGFDGVVLLAFILGFPANEIVLPIATMVYTSGIRMSEAVGLSEMGQIFTNNGWSIKTAVCVILFSLMHWPCSTTLLTVKKETGSFKWTFLAFLVPTLLGIAVCAVVNLVFSLFGY